MVFIVVPAYNEEKQIGRVVRGLFEQDFANVIVVDDGSEDETAREAAAAGAKVLRHQINRGQGAALQTGNQYALSKGACHVAHFDGDGQFNAQDIHAALKFMAKKDVGIVLGSRFLDNRSQIPWVKRKIILPVARFVDKFLTGVKLTDVHNGFRVLSRAALCKITITQDGMAHNSEIVAQVKKNGIKFCEYPVEVKYTEFGQGIGGGFKIVLDMIKSNIFN